MMSVVDRMIVDLNTDHTASVLTWLEGDDLPEVSSSFPLAWPLDADALTELRWYLEEYLILPSGVYGDRGLRIAEQVSRWGEALFAAVFGAGTPARDAYLRLRARGNSPVLVLRSPSPELLGLPWELMRDPALRDPLALNLAGLSRSIPGVTGTEDISVPVGKLRVLMVIARPQGESEVAYQMVARPLIERLPALRGTVDLVVLRPPTLQALTAALAEARDQGTPYHVVHFDGHGYRIGRGSPVAGPLLAPGDQPTEAGLVFESPDGGADRVPAVKVARALSDAKVPVVVLNACQSGAIGKDLEAAIATRLLREGSASVVAMSYNVYAVAAAEFMAGFYERLFAGDSVSTAVTAGRNRMFLNSDRPSRAGDTPLQDWLVPVHYLRHDVRFPQAVTVRAGSLSRDEELAQIRPSGQADQGDADLDPAGTFVGRDWLLCQLESAFRLKQAVVLCGTGGTGKTELAKAFGRWWRDTRGVEKPEYVFFYSFGPGTATFGLDGVIDQIGRRLFQADFDLLGPSQRRAAVEAALTERRMLLIWDNFETVRSMPDPDGSARPLDEDGCNELRAFLARLAGGESRVLITSRSPETWLGDISRVTVAGLTAQEANQYASYLLAPHGAARARRWVPEFGDLMDWLDGHPLAMRLTLPHLETSEPAALLDALRGEPSPESAAASNRLTSLSASIAYSYTHLSSRARRLLPAIALFRAVAAADILTVFSQCTHVPSRFRDASQADWLAVLNEAAGTGLVTATAANSGAYLIPPGLPAYLAARWQAEDPASYQAERNAAVQAMLIACGLIGSLLCDKMETGDTGDTGAACDTVGRHSGTFGSMLTYAIAHRLWVQADLLLSPLQRYWEMRGLGEEAGTWLGKIRQAAESAVGAHDPLYHAADLWTSVVQGQLRWQMTRRQFGQAEHTAGELLSRLKSLPSSAARQSSVGSTYLHLGQIARYTGRLDVASDWYGKMLDVSAAIGDEQGKMEAYQSLGVIARQSGNRELAADYYRKALAIADAADDKSGAADIYHSLARIYWDMGQLDTTLKWYRKALKVCAESDNKPKMADTIYYLGRVALRREQFDAAEAWFRQGFALAEDLGDQIMLARILDALGMVASNRRQLDTAEEWYHKALALAQELGDAEQLGTTMTHLGLITEFRRNYTGALDWYIRGVTQFGDFRYPVVPHWLPLPYGGERGVRGHPNGPALLTYDLLALLTDQLGWAMLADRWRAVTGSELPAEVKDQITYINFARAVKLATAAQNRRNRWQMIPSRRSHGGQRNCWLPSSDRTQRARWRPRFTRGSGQEEPRSST